jgi:hypothetical protein
MVRRATLQSLHRTVSGMQSPLRPAVSASEDRFCWCGVHHCSHKQVPTKHWYVVSAFFKDIFDYLSII